jgi:hypothetical protein
LRSPYASIPLACYPSCQWISADIQARRYGDRVACYTRDVVYVVEDTMMIRRPDGTEENKVWK